MLHGTLKIIYKKGFLDYFSLEKKKINSTAITTLKRSDTMQQK